ncbi:NAD(P)/FAD-dependent oxidoreductase [Anaerocolumna sp. AGMB13020]|uniref:NAD(P)/FAD-dependent oxidoreductase n=1 Tax=Anaerocolumna sp. AGMB13020 TaxID=3081750 RepID=UPI002952A3DB|nr:NAD(P)/FAD-dependent oxidoreductase [Anaerocolumna sp. AGMB13020]WOO36454.1 NAD(P)/FAD-dependent oxidoreductase [Anaerocolumna sp. AGMB13020]
MLQISQLKLRVGHSTGDLYKLAAKTLKITEQEIQQLVITKKSIDARKEDIFYVYQVEVQIAAEEKKLAKLKAPNVTIAKAAGYDFKPSGINKLSQRPVIAGFGPAGLFCGLMLARNGYNPIILERGEEVDSRVKSVEEFWKSGKLNRESNVQFGEGGAGTFSDGKLNTLVKDKWGRNQEVLKILAEHGAPEEILYLNKPHIGTDKLRNVVKAIREEIKSLGGEVRFNTCLTDVKTEKGTITGVELNHEEFLSCDCLVLALGHSARDTFKLLWEKRMKLTSKSFAIGLRMEHPQILISRNQYGNRYTELPPADYKLTHNAVNGRGIYSFCMCPGGFVVNASSEEGRLAVNGMSNHARDERNANSALIVTVTPPDFKELVLKDEQGFKETYDGVGAEENPMIGVEFQRIWEAKAYEAGRGRIPVQLYGDFKCNRTSSGFGSITPNTKGEYNLANLRDCLPEYVSTALMDGIQAFERRIEGFSNEEAVLTGVETRTSSPLRMERDEFFEASIKGIYPCGEGAGYAGGITSAAIDGIKVFEAIASKYKANEAYN